MPWNRESPMDQRIKLIGDCLQGSYSKSELARHYGLSRPTRSSSSRARPLHHTSIRAQDRVDQLRGAVSNMRALECK
jgi:transposase-like protein